MLMNHIIEIGAVMLASGLAMILHELPKSIVYILTGRHCLAEDRRRIFRLHRYIDPLGWLLFLTCHAGCSKPYAYRLKEKDTNIAVGMTGFLTLGIMIMGGYALYHLKIVYLPVTSGWDSQGYLMLFIIQASWYFIYASMVLLIVNLIPLLSSDISLLIIAFSPKRLISLSKNDMMIKGLLLISIIFGWISSLALQGIGGLDRIFGYV